ncbi:SDR family NAD(P)-dependent oxidoreductase [Actinomadura sp. 7K507]|uniref:SDR family NAD(P)-dependent oxidoreductase n=1 Tax=Actinomadura sp. 7K507 TaxID=2530365 RepID=UPI00104DCEDC|nr:SDR family NAD(P)-dependent oxidoreductase [Actinomadura sp. 7K507]TDC84778.1 SDR family NAD(P)-dependent oxidoreductase [Actinomadura sp. 7K507]
MGRRGVALRETPVLVTGASSGIGRALALELAGRGARLAIAARRAANLEEIADRIAAAGGPRPHVLETDLSRPGAAADLADRALAALGTVGVLVNNAGRGLAAAQCVTGDDLAARELFEVNFWSPIALTRALLPALTGQSGTVVNVTSTLQAVPIPTLGYYGAGKAALGHMTRTLRNELAGTGVSVLEVVPGGTDTAARDVDLLPWRNGPMRTPPPVTPGSSARAIATAIEKGKRRRVHPRSSLVPLEAPTLGRLIAATVARRLATPDPRDTTPERT